MALLVCGPQTLGNDNEMSKVKKLFALRPRICQILETCTHEHRELLVVGNGQWAEPHGDPLEADAMHLTSRLNNAS